MKQTNIIFKYFKQLSHYFSASLIPMLLNLMINPLVAMNMAPEDFAIIGYFTSFTTLISPIIAFYMLHYYNKRYFELDQSGREHLRALLYKALIFFSFGVTIICLLFLSIYINEIEKTSFKTFPYLYLAVMSVPFTGIYNLELADYKMKRESKQYLRLSLVRGGGGVLLVLMFVVFLKWGAIGKLSATLLTEVCIFVYLLYKHIDVWKINTKAKEILPILKFCWPLALGAALGYFSNGYDKLVLESLNNNTEFGYYCVGGSIAAYLAIFTTSISSTFQPDTYQAIISNDRCKFYKIALLRLLLILLVVILFVLFCPLVVRILTAGKYMASVPYARALSLVPITSSLYYIINDYSIAKGKPLLYLYTTIFGTVAILWLMPLFVKCFSFQGGAIMNVLSFVVLFLINLILLLLSKRRS